MVIAITNNSHFPTKFSSMAAMLLSTPISRSIITVVLEASAVFYMYDTVYVYNQYLHT